jgi:hypothetical protein
MGRSDVGLAVTVDIKDESVMAGHFKCHESLECAVVVDRLRVAAGGQRVNLPTKALQDQVGCFCVCGRVCQSQMPRTSGHGSQTPRSRWEQRLDGMILAASDIAVLV